MFEGDFEDMCAGKFLQVSMEGQADPSSLHRRGLRTPIAARGDSNTKKRKKQTNYLYFRYEQLFRPNTNPGNKIRPTTFLIG